MPSKTISIDRAPVLTLWAPVEAERLAFDEDEAMSLEKCMAGLAAQRGHSLGIFEPQEEGADAARGKERGPEFWIDLCSRALSAGPPSNGCRP